ncbi:MAG TPA: response regulator [Polyangiaceae bacterium]|nr:response regulator [Polyangiaceae bacterium]
MSQEKRPLGRILLEQRAVSAEQLEKALADKSTSGRLASRLTEQGILREVEALKALSEQFGVPGIDLGQICLRLEDLDLLPREIAEQHHILPVLVRDDQMFVAVANPRETKVLEELEFVTGKKVYPYIALDGVLRRVIQTAYGRKARGEVYYVAPRCPAEVLERLGINPDGTFRDTEQLGAGFEQQNQPASDQELRTPAEGESKRPIVSQRPGSIPDEPIPRGTPALVVGDAVRLSASDDIEEDDFGQLSRDLSIVSELPGTAVTDTTAGRKVLVVDDDLDIRRMVVRLLRTRGLTVLEADRGLLALRLVKEHNPHLIVLDAMLPEVHGFEIAKRIKHSKRYGRTPIIMVSAVYRGWRFAEDLKQSCGVDRFLEKPFRIEELLRSVDECLLGRAEDTEQEIRSERVAEAETALHMGVDAYRAGRLEEAIAHLKRGISIDPLAYRLHFHLGLLYGKCGQVFEAISELEAAMDLNSKHFAASKNLAILYQKAGFRNKAAETWERALRLAPDDETRRTIKDHLLNLL